jgi:hypothetical protein
MCIVLLLVYWRHKRSDFAVTSPKAVPHNAFGKHNTLGEQLAYNGHHQEQYYQHCEADGGYVQQRDVGALPIAQLAAAAAAAEPQNSPFLIPGLARGVRCGVLCCIAIGL